MERAVHDGPPALRLPLVPELPLRTERLLLRAFEPADEAFVWDLFSRPEVHRWLYTSAIERVELAAWLERRLAGRVLREDGALRLLAVEAASGALVGDFALHVASAEHARGEIGFVLHPDRGGRGYATEGAAELLRVGFEQAGFHRIIGRLEARNAASAAVMERLGMRREAHLVENEWVKGSWESEVSYALLAREWAAAQAGAGPGAPGGGSGAGA